MPAGKTDVRRPGRPANPIGRDAIIAIAKGVFAEGGYAGASLSQIAERTGLRKASLYHHFSSKESLYLAVLDTLISDLRDMFAEALLSQGDFGQRLETASSAVVEYLADNSEAAQILVREMVDGGPFVEAHGSDAIAMTVDVASQFFELGMDSGYFRRQDPKQLMLSLMGLVLYSYAAGEISRTVLATDHLSGEGRTARNAALKEQIRILCIA